MRSGVSVCSKLSVTALCRAKTEQETVIAGLLGDTTPYLLEVVEMQEKGRGVRVMEEVPVGSYVREYEADRVYPRKHRASQEEEYVRNDEGCYILDILTRDGWMCLDATRCFSSVGRLLNHAQECGDPDPVQTPVSGG